MCRLPETAPLPLRGGGLEGRRSFRGCNACRHNAPAPLTSRLLPQSERSRACFTHAPRARRLLPPRLPPQTSPANALAHDARSDPCRDSGGGQAVPGLVARESLLLRTASSLSRLVSRGGCQTVPRGRSFQEWARASCAAPCLHRATRGRQRTRDRRGRRRSTGTHAGCTSTASIITCTA